MKIAFLSTIKPNASATEGGGITCYEFLRGLKKSGHEIIYVDLNLQAANSSVEEDNELSAEVLDTLCISQTYSVACPHAAPARWVLRLPQPFRSLLGIFSQWQRGKHIRAEVSSKIQRLVAPHRPDVYFAFSEAIPFTPTQSKVPVACWAIHSGEPYRKIALDLGLWKVFKSHKIAAMIYPFWRYCSHRHSVQMMKKMKTVIMHSYYWGKEQDPYFRDHQNFWAVPHPGADALPEVCRGDVFSGSGEERYDVVLIGRKRTSFGRANIEYLLEEIAPEIQKRNLEDKFCFSLVGPQDVAEEQLARMKQYPFIRDEGYVENIAERVNRADVMLHAVKYKPSAGSRFGLLCSIYPCLVAHEAICETVPELYNNGACLIAQDGASFVDALEQACFDKEQNVTLRKNARQVYEKYYTYERFFAFLNEALHATLGTDYDAEIIKQSVYDLEEKSSADVLSQIENEKNDKSIYHNRKP